MCFDRVQAVERQVCRLEQYWTQQRRMHAQEDAAPGTTKQARDEALQEGLGQENEEIAAFLERWSSGLESRLGVLVKFEQHKLLSRGSETEHRGTQVDEQMLPTADEGAGAAGAGRGHSTSELGLQDDMDDEDEGGTGPFLEYADEAARAKTGFQRSMLRARAATQLQAVWRGYRDRRIVGNIPQADITFFHSRDPRIRVAWVSCARRPPPRRSQQWLAATIAQSLRAKITHDYVRKKEGKAPLSFVDFLYDHLFECYGDSASVHTDVVALLCTIDRIGGEDLTFAAVQFFLMTLWDTKYCTCLLRAMCLAHAEVNNQELNVINPKPELEKDVALTEKCIQKVVKKLMTAPITEPGLGRKRATEIAEEVLAKSMEYAVDRIEKEEQRRARRWQRVGRRSPTAASPGAQQKTLPTQKEFYFSLLMCVTPGMLLAAGFAGDDARH